MAYRFVQSPYETQILRKMECLQDTNEDGSN